MSNIEDYDTTIQEIKTEVTNHEELKKDKVIRCADILEKNGYPTEKISRKLREDLKGFIHHDWLTRCLDAKFKNPAMVRTPPQKIAVTTDGTHTAEDDSTSTAREQYEKNKYYKNVPKGSSLKAGSKMVTPEQETEDVLQTNKETNEYIGTLKEQLQKQETEIRTMKDERLMHTSVSLHQNKFQELLNFISDKKIKRIFLDFDENMSVTRVRAEV